MAMADRARKWFVLVLRERGKPLPVVGRGVMRSTAGEMIVVL
jgi:hypothetical protein